MKYVVLIYSDQNLLDALPEGRFESMMRGCIKHADELRVEGKLLDSQMLMHSRSARSVRIRNGRSTTVDGPFTETKEMLAGFNLIEARDLDEAMEIAAGFPWAETGCIEIRPVDDMDAMRIRVHAAA